MHTDRQTNRNAYLQKYTHAEHTDACMHACMHACMCVYVCMQCVCIYVYIYICTHRAVHAPKDHHFGPGGASNASRPSTPVPCASAPGAGPSTGGAPGKPPLKGSFKGDTGPYKG